MQSLGFELLAGVSLWLSVGWMDGFRGMAALHACKYTYTWTLQPLAMHHKSQGHSSDLPSTLDGP